MTDQTPERDNAGPWRFGPGDQWTALKDAPTLLAFSGRDVGTIHDLLAEYGLDRDCTDLLLRIREATS